MAQHKHAPRECRIVKSDEYVGYGFNLYQEKNKPGQFIGRIEPGSPADKAGLLENDRLVEVNGVNIAGENHKQVVARIKSMMMETILLVSDTNSDNYHKERGIIIKNSLPYVIKLSNCSDDDITNNGDNHDENNAVTDYIDDDDEIIDTRLQKVSFKNTESKIVKPTRSVKIVTDNDRDIVNKSEVNRDCSRQDSGVCEEEVDAITKAVTNNNNNNETDITELGLNLSVEEVKERIRRRRKHDPRTIPVKRASGDWWNQYKMIQTL